jgi:hypothetical protein
VNRNDINLEYDSQTQEYGIIWEPVVIGMGKTKVAALEDLRERRHTSA